MLRGPGLTPHKIRAERPSNLSFQKFLGAGLTPHFHDERSSNVSLRARVSSRCSPPSLPHYRGPLYYFYCQLRMLVMLRPQVRLPGPAVRTRSGAGGVVKLDSAHTFIFSVSDDIVYDRLWHC